MRLGMFYEWQLPQPWTDTAEHNMRRGRHSTPGRGRAEELHRAVWGAGDTAVSCGERRGEGMGSMHSAGPPTPRLSAHDRRTPDCQQPNTGEWRLPAHDRRTTKAASPSRRNDTAGDRP